MQHDINDKTYHDGHTVFTSYIDIDPNASLITHNITHILFTN